MEWSISASTIPSSRSEFITSLQNCMVWILYTKTQLTPSHPQICMPVSYHDQTIQDEAQNQTVFKDKSFGNANTGSSLGDPLDGFVMSQVHDHSMSPYSDTLTTDNSIGISPCCDIHGNLAAQLANLPRECPSNLASNLGSYSQYINPSDIMVWQPLSTEQTPAINFAFSTSRGRDMPIVQVTVEPDSTIVANFFDAFPTSDWTQPPLPPDTQWERTDNMTTGSDEGPEEIQVFDSGLRTQSAGQNGPLLMIEDDTNCTRTIKNEAERIKRIMRELEEMENRQRIHAQNQLKTIGDGL